VPSLKNRLVLSCLLIVSWADPCNARGPRTCDHPKEVIAWSGGGIQPLDAGIMLCGRSRSQEETVWRWQGGSLIKDRTCKTVKAWCGTPAGLAGNRYAIVINTAKEKKANARPMVRILDVSTNRDLFAPQLIVPPLDALGTWCPWYQWWVSTNGRFIATTIFSHRTQGTGELWKICLIDASEGTVKFIPSGAGRPVDRWGELGNAIPSNDGKRVGAFGNTVGMFDTVSQKMLWSKDMRACGLWAGCFSADQKTFWVGGALDDVWELDAETGKTQNHWFANKMGQQGEGKGSVCHLTVSPDNAYVAAMTEGYDNASYVWSRKSSTVVRLLHGEGKIYMGFVGFSPDSQSLVSYDFLTFKIWPRSLWGTIENQGSRNGGALRSRGSLVARDHIFKRHRRHRGPRHRGQTKTFYFESRKSWSDPDARGLTPMRVRVRVRGRLEAFLADIRCEDLPRKLNFLILLLLPLFFVSCVIKFLRFLAIDPRSRPM
jgi:hypothetical protein